MKLLLDIGNSRLKWAFCDGGPLQGGDAHEHRGDPATLLHALALPDAESVWISQVLGAEHEPALTEAVGAHCGAAPRFARTLKEWNGLRVAYADPSRLGVDRWLGMVALWAQQRRAFGVVHAGTALTFDAVDESGQHAGGLIAPGLVTAQKSILGATRFGSWSKAPEYSAGLGRDTETCVGQGALHASAGLIERAVRLAAGDRVITGGDAQALLPHIGNGWTHRPHLVLDGLLALAESDGDA